MRTKNPRTLSLAWGASTAALLTGLGLMATPATASFHIWHKFDVLDFYMTSDGEGG